MQRRSHAPLISILLLLALIGAMAGCKDKEYTVPFVGPAAGDTTAGGGETQRITLFVTPWHTAILPTDTTEGAEFQISASVENAFGQPMPDGTRVIWMASIGTLSTTSSTTTDGETNVTLTFPDGYEGCSWITAISGDAEDTEYVCAELVPPQPNKVLILTAKNTSVAATENTTITATVRTNGEPDVGILVSFEITLGLDYAVLSAGAAVTDSSGKASVTFRAENTSGSEQMVEITAGTSDGREQIIQIKVDK